MMKFVYISLLLMFALSDSYGQKERKLVREGVNDYKDDKYAEAEVQFRKALDAKPDLYEADYDIVNSLYKQKKFEEAAAGYERLIQSNTNPGQRADLFHNLGNSQVMAQQFEKGIDAYKNALRIRPEDEETRYNLAYALEKLKQQQEQQKNNENKDQKDQENQDKQDQNKENQDQQKNEEDKQQQNEDQKKKEEQNQDQKEESQQNVSKQEAEQMLNAVQNQEKEVKDKVDKKKAVARPIGTDKDW